jgi:glycerol-3-phosphate acyltransferase PlsY
MTGTTVLFCLGAFMAGSIPTAYLVARRLEGIDIRKHGSGNVGATNAFRVLGNGPGSFVFLIDFLKGFLPVMLYQAALPGFAPEAALGVGAAAILGHMLTPFLGFKGGKGVATGSGAIAAFNPLLFLVALLVWLITFGAIRIVSLSSLAAAIALFVSSAWLYRGGAVMAIFGGFLGLALWGHRNNLVRLLRRTEKKL